MPRYKFGYTIETPLRGERDVTFTHGAFEVTLNFSRPLDPDHISGYAVTEGRNWTEANAIAMEDAFGPVLDMLSSHRKAPAMVQDLLSAVKAETGTTRRAVLFDIHKEIQPVGVDDLAFQEVQDALNRNGADRPALRWLRYSYRAIPALERFVFAWLAFENFCGVQSVIPTCPHCDGKLRAFPSTDRNEAFRILQSREPQLARTEFDQLFKDWWSELRSAVFHGGCRLDTALRQRMLNAIERFRPAVENLVQQEAGFRRAYPGTRSNDGLFQMFYRHFVEFECDPNEGEFADAPQPPTRPGDISTLRVSDGMNLLPFEEAENW
jgi:hypothetical protein